MDGRATAGYSGAPVKHNQQLAEDSVIAGGQHFGSHVDGAIRLVAGSRLRVRTDVSVTLFLTPPDHYRGGELVIEDTYGVHPVKLPAGHAVVYPATSLHHVRPVTAGTRLASFL